VKKPKISIEDSQRVKGIVCLPLEKNSLAEKVTTTREGEK